jgi:type III secretion protein Q
MSVQALRLPRFSAVEAEARRRLGRGLRLPFAVDDEPGELLLEPGPGPSGGTPVTLECAHGHFCLSEPSAVLSLFGGCPVILPAEPGADDWFWALFHEALSPQLRALFGQIKPLAEPTPTDFDCRLSVRLGEARAVCRLSLAPEVLLALRANAAWQPLATALPADWPLQLPLPLGRLRLGIGQLRRLRPGDVLLPEEPLFDPSGHGQLRLGRHLLAVRLDNRCAPPHLTVLAYEENDMHDDFEPATDWSAQQDAPEAEQEDTGEPEPFADLPLALTLRCGKLQLNLGELQELAPGMLLEVADIGPGMASLYYGERPVAHGELVEIDGRLGLQVTRVDFAG